MNFFNAMLLTTSLFAGALAGAEDKIIKVDGSSTVYPITEAMAEQYQGSKKDASRVTVGISGTGGGFKKFCRGETDIQDASRPITTAEMEDCKKMNVKYFELPIAYDATVVAVNAKNKWLNEITADELKMIWEPAAQGKIKKWNQVNAKWPDQEIKLYGAGSDSGTFDYFTEAIVGKAKSSRGDYTASEDDNTLVKGITGNEFALGYIPMSYYIENKKNLKAVAVIGGAKAPLKTGVLPSKETVENGTYYPLSRPLFIYVNEASAKRADVKDFVNFYLKNAVTIVPEVKYIALPSKAYTLGAEHFSKGKLGTIFGKESHIGLKIEDLMKKETTF
ncbi:MAG: PstS family phosphate ABC transporter substrate-binding protein [Bdellovibrionaceae bacterium]|nr:PstS family phosphate ABC transporter substrate-binding protein [Bdellovibrio sp.]